MRCQSPVGGSCSHPRSRLAGWDGVCWGGILLPRVYPKPCRYISLHPRCRTVIWEQQGEWVKNGGDGWAGL